MCGIRLIPMAPPEFYTKLLHLKPAKFAHSSVLAPCSSPFDYLILVGVAFFTIEDKNGWVFGSASTISQLIKKACVTYRSGWHTAEKHSKENTYFCP